MKDIRKGNDIQYTWTVKNLEGVNGEKVVQLISCKTNVAQEAMTYSISGNVITGTFYGKDQKDVGAYRLLLLVNDGYDNMVTLDKVNAFNLTGVCNFGIVRGADDNAIETVVLEFESEIHVNVGASGEQVQADWDETNTDSPAYIRNKPTIPPAQVQSNWNETDTNSKAFIQNKPTIPPAQVQSNWNETDTNSKAFIQNKPTIPDAQVQSNWNETDTNSKAFIQNKPTIPAAQVQSDWNATTGMGVILNKPTIPDVTGKEDKIAIDSTAKTASFTASVGNYYTVNIAASGSVTITLTTPSDNTHISNAVFLVTTSTSPALTFSAASGVDIYVSSSYSIEASKIYEINALWNGVNWSIASVELEVQS